MFKLKHTEINEKGQKYHLPWSIHETHHGSCQVGTLSASMVNESGAVKFLHIVAVPWQKSHWKISMFNSKFSGFWEFQSLIHWLKLWILEYSIWYSDIVQWWFFSVFWCFQTDECMATFHGDSDDFQDFEVQVGRKSTLFCFSRRLKESWISKLNNLPYIEEIRDRNLYDSICIPDQFCRHLRTLSKVKSVRSWKSHSAEGKTKVHVIGTLAAEQLLCRRMIDALNILQHFSPKGSSWCVKKSEKTWKVPLMPKKVTVQYFSCRRPPVFIFYYYYYYYLHLDYLGPWLSSNQIGYFQGS